MGQGEQSPCPFCVLLNANKQKGSESMTRRQFFVQAQIDRYAWAIRVDAQNVAYFENMTARRYGNGKRK